MSFIKKVADAGMLGIPGLVLSSLHKKKKDESAKPSLVSGDYATNTGSNSPSLISKNY